MRLSHRRGYHSIELMIFMRFDLVALVCKICERTASVETKASASG